MNIYIPSFMDNDVAYRKLVGSGIVQFVKVSESINIPLDRLGYNTVIPHYSLVYHDDRIDFTLATIDPNSNSVLIPIGDGWSVRELLLVAEVTNLRPPSGLPPDVALSEALAYANWERKVYIISGGSVRAAYNAPVVVEVEFSDGHREYIIVGEIVWALLAAILGISGVVGWIIHSWSEAVKASALADAVRRIAAIASEDPSTARILAGQVAATIVEGNNNKLSDLLKWILNPETIASIIGLLLLLEIIRMLRR